MYKGSIITQNKTMPQKYYLDKNGNLVNPVRNLQRDLDSEWVWNRHVPRTHSQNLGFFTLFHGRTVIMTHTKFFNSVCQL